MALMKYKALALMLIGIVLISGCVSQTEIPPLSDQPEDVNICVPNWQCSEWGSCVRTDKVIATDVVLGIQNRTCNDLNACNTPPGAVKPVDSQECTIPKNDFKTLCSHMNPQFSCNVFDMSYCGSIDDKMNRGTRRSASGYFEIIGANGYVPSSVSCREGKYAGERSDVLYCVLDDCHQISENGIIKGWGGQFGLGEYIVRYEQMNNTKDGNIYTYSLVSCAEANKIFSSEGDCFVYVWNAKEDKKL